VKFFDYFGLFALEIEDMLDLLLAALFGMGSHSSVGGWHIRPFVGNSALHGSQGCNIGSWEGCSWAFDPSLGSFGSWALGFASCFPFFVIF